MNFNIKYAPNALAEFPFTDEKQRRALMSYAGGTNLRPLILHGFPGTGKSLLSRLIPKAMCPDIDEASDLLFLNGCSENGIDVVRARIRTFATTTKFNSLGISWIVIDEADGLTNGAQDALKGLMDEMAKHTMFILTTNDLRQISAPIRDRCERVTFSIPYVHQLLPTAQRILKAEGVHIPDAKVQDLLRGDYYSAPAGWLVGISYRELCRRMEKAVEEHRRRNSGTPAHPADVQHISDDVGAQMS